MLTAYAQRRGSQLEQDCDLAVRLWAAAAQIQALEAQAEWVLGQSFPQTATGVYLDRHAAMRNMTRQAAGKAVGSLTFTLANTQTGAVNIPAGTVCMTEDAVRFQTVEDAAVPAGEISVTAAAEAVESGAVSPDDPVTASRRAASMGGSQIWLEEGEVMTVAEMTKCVAVVSANDCAVALAEALCGSEEAFVARMNRRAEELGLSDTHFTNCTGLFEDAEHYTCAYDIAVMSRELLKHEFVRQYTTLWQDTIRSGEFGLTNTNKLVRHYNGCTGLKTGFTSTAMYCLAASAERGGVEYIAVILHGETSQLRFDAARTLLDYAFANYTLVMPETGAPDVPVSLGKAASVRAVCESSGTVLIEKARQKELSAVYELPEKVDAPVAAGQLLGTLRYVAGNETIASVPISAAESVERVGVGELWVRLAAALCGRTNTQ